MTEKEIQETLEKQLQLLSERSSSPNLDSTELAGIIQVHVPNSQIADGPGLGCYFCGSSGCCFIASYSRMVMMAAAEAIFEIAAIIASCGVSLKASFSFS